MNTIIINAGHGGKDPGALGNNLRESNLNLSLSLVTEYYLNQYNDCRIIMPRRNDVYVGLTERRDIAEKANADLYISQHCNAYHDVTARGFETFIFNGEVYSTTEKAQIDIHTSVYNVLAKYNMPNRGMKRSSHWEPKNIRVPVVLIEYGFVTNKLDADILRSTEIIKELGKATAEGIAKTLNLSLKSPFDWSFPVGPMPSVQRRVGIVVNDKVVDEVGYLINNATYVRAAFVMGLSGVEVTGHGGHIKIKV